MPFFKLWMKNSLEHEAKMQKGKAFKQFSPRWIMHNPDDESQAFVNAIALEASKNSLCISCFQTKCRMSLLSFPLHSRKTANLIFINTPS